MNVNNLLKHKCDIYRSVTLGEGKYGITETEMKPIGTNVKCHVQQISRLSAYYRHQLSGISDKIYFIGYFKSNANITEGDRVIWQGYTMLVLSTPPSLDGSGKIDHKEAYMELQDK